MNYLLSYEALPPEIKAQLTRITEAYFSEELIWKSTACAPLSSESKV